MAPSWIPLCRSMQLYCEPYFASINNWREYKSDQLIHNRLEMIETVCQIFHVYSQNPELHTFELVCENDVPLMEEVQPTAGRDYRVGGDQIAFSTAMTTQPKVLFHKGGVFFQDNLLKGIAGWSPEVLAGSNIETRASIIAAVEKLFRIPEEAGIARFAYIHQPNTTAYVKKQQKDYPTCQLSHKGDQFYRYIEASRKANFDFDADDAKVAHPEIAMVVAVETKKNKRARAADEKEDEWEEDADGVMWTRKHHSVGSKVAAHFPPLEPQSHLVPTHDDQHIQVAASGVTSKLFKGKVTKYAPPSASGLTDQLYHIRWEDGDEQDFDEVDIQRGMDLYDTIDGWTTRHAMVGMRVAAYFPMPVKGSRGSAQEVEQVLFCGSVMKFGRALTEDDVSLYHVLFDDGDEQDFSEHELQMGIELFNLEGISTKGKAAASPAAKAAGSTKKAKVEKEVQPVVAATSSTRPAAVKKEIHPDLAKPAASKPKPVKQTKAAAALFGKQSAKPAKKSTSSKSSINDTVAKDKNTPSKPARSDTTSLLEEVGEEEGADDPVWSVQHHSVFKRVAQRFEVPGPKGSKPKWDTFGGTVVAYAPPTAPGLRDQLYHVVWDDGDEQDYDEPDLQAGLVLLESMMPTPLYVASAQTKALVAKRQRELVVDFDYSSISSSVPPSSSAASGAVSSGSKTATPAKSSSSDSRNGEVHDLTQAAVDVVDMTQAKGEASSLPAEQQSTVADDIEAWAESVDAADLAHTLSSAVSGIVSGVQSVVEGVVHEVTNAYNEHSTVEELFHNANSANKSGHVTNTDTSSVDGVSAEVQIDATQVPDEAEEEVREAAAEEVEQEVGPAVVAEAAQDDGTQGGSEEGSDSEEVFTDAD